MSSHLKNEIKAWRKHLREAEEAIEEYDSRGVLFDYEDSDPWSKGEVALTMDLWRDAIERRDRIDARLQALEEALANE